MDKARLSQAIESVVGKTLANDLAADFVKIRLDYATKVLERASCGKFVETFVQALQHIDKGKYEAKPNVDDYLDKHAQNAAKVPDGLKICGARAARTMYTLRNKRNIAHKNPVDSNTYDLALIHQSAAWIMAELIRHASGVTMQEAGALIDLIQAPVGTLVEEIDGVRLVHADVSVPMEIVILLHSYYPDFVPVPEILKSMYTRNAKSVTNSLGTMRAKKQIFGDSSSGYRLTATGYAMAVKELEKHRV